MADGSVDESTSTLDYATANASSPEAMLMAKPVCEQMTDAGQFGYAAVCAMSLNQLYQQPCHKDFNLQCIKIILAHLKQPKQVETSILAIVNGHGGDSTEPFVNVLSAEDCVIASPMCIIQDLMAVVLNNGYYDARMRILIKHIAFLLRVNWEEVEDYEEMVVQQLQEEAHCSSEEEIKERTKSEKNRKRKRYFLIGLATVGGGALIGLTGGLAAPLLAAGAGAIIGGAGAAALGTTAGIAIIGSLFGVAGAGLTGYKMKKRVGAIEQFEFMPIAESSQLHITIAISGWLSKDESDFALPWKTLAHSKEQYCLKWEGKYLLQMGQAIDYLFNGVVTVAAQEALKYTILSGIISAIAWPASLVTLAGVIDNPWSVCIRRSSEAGKQLAEVLLSREQGRRPVTLIGFSLGARVIFYCLQELAKRKEFLLPGAEGIIEDVVLLGTPVTADPRHWEPFARIVSGNIINGYCRGDWLLKFLYRTAAGQLRMAGLQPIKWNDRRMLNIDLSDLVSGHTDYINKLDEILKIVGMKTKDPPKRATQLRMEASSSSSETTPEHTASAGKSSESDSGAIVVETVPKSTHLKRLTRTTNITEDIAETGLDALALDEDSDDLYVSEKSVMEDKTVRDTARGVNSGTAANSVGVNSGTGGQDVNIGTVSSDSGTIAHDVNSGTICDFVGHVNSGTGTGNVNSDTYVCDVNSGTGGGDVNSGTGARSVNSGTCINDVNSVTGSLDVNSCRACDSEQEDQLVAEIDREAVAGAECRDDKSAGVEASDTGQVGRWGEWELDWDQEFYADDEDDVLQHGNHGTTAPSNPHRKVHSKKGGKVLHSNQVKTTELVQDLSKDGAGHNRAEAVDCDSETPAGDCQC